jgi:hypothetical protein
MRILLALVIAVPLLLAGSAWAGTYDGEWRGSGVLECNSIDEASVRGWSQIELHMRFIVAGNSFEGNFGEGAVKGGLELDAIKGRAFGFGGNGAYLPVLRLKGSLRTGRINLIGALGGTNCHGETQVSRIEASLQKKTVTASKSTTSSGKTVTYCRTESGNVYKSNPETCRHYTKKTKAEYEMQRAD